MQPNAAQGAEPHDDVRELKPQLHVATYIRLRSFGRVFSFMLLNMSVYQNARAREGFVAGGIRTKFWRKEFWTYTTWADREKMMAFVGGRPHSEAVARFSEAAEVGYYVEWESNGLPVWSEALERLEKPTGRLG